MPVVNRPYTNWFTGEGYPSVEVEKGETADSYGPFLPNPPATGEFSFETLTAPLTKAGANAARLLSSSSTVIDQGSKPAWYDLTGRISNAASSVNDAFQSTLIKIIIILALVGFGFIYFQAKVVNLANTK